MQTSQVGRDFIARQEWAPFTKECGWDPTSQLYFPYKDYRGFWTFGAGHLIVPGDHFADGRTHAQVEELFSLDLQRYEDAVRRYVTADLSQHEFDALVSFAYNLGVGKLDPNDNPSNRGGNTAVRVLNAGRRDLVPQYLLPYDMSAGVHDANLRKRRAAEGRMFGTPYPEDHGLRAQVTEALLSDLERAQAWARIAQSLDEAVDEEAQKWGRQDLG